MKRLLLTAATGLTVFATLQLSMESKETEFQLMETTIDDIHAAFKSGKLTSRKLAEMYLSRIEAFDKKGPALNSIIAVNPTALEEADHLDAAFKKSGPVGPLHGIPILLKDQADVKGMPTTLGSLVLKDHMATRDAFVIAKLKKAGAFILAKTTLAEFAGGDTYGSLFGETKNPYDLLRTPGGSSGGSGAALAANFGAVALGQEGYSSIRRPSSWNALVGMRPTAGLVSRSGVYSGWPTKNGSLGPMTRTVKDMAILLDSMTGYDPEDPVTAMGVGQTPVSYTATLKKDGLRGARLGILREPNGNLTEPDSDDFKEVDAAFTKAVSELKAQGAEVVDPIVIPNLKALLAKRASGPGEGAENMRVFLGHSPDPKMKDMKDVVNSPDYDKVFPARKQMLSGGRGGTDTAHYEYLKAREELMINLMKVMADHKLDAIVHKSVEHSPTLIADGIKPPYPGMKGALHINTFLVYVSSVTVPAGFTGKTNLPVGITFLGRPYSEPTMLKFAYAYEQATHHRKAPKSTPSLAMAR